MKSSGSEHTSNMRLIALIFGLIVVGSIPRVAPAIAAVKLNISTTPDNGVAGVNNVNITGSGFPSEMVTPENVSVSLATTCGGLAAATVAAASVKNILGTSKRVNFLVPDSLAKGTYFLGISDSADSVPFASSNCSEVNVTSTNPVLSACVPASSLGVIAPVTGPAPVTAYVPNGCWSCGLDDTGVQFVPLEPRPVASPTSIGTASTVNSCAANPVTGEAVCVANDTNVYTISGATLTDTLTSSSNNTARFSGGSCQNCGVAIDALNNKAVIAMGFMPSPSPSPAPSGTGIQYLDLGNSTFESPFPLLNEVSEDISIDPTRALVLSANEGLFSPPSSYDLLQTPATGLVEYQNKNIMGANGLTAGVMDSSAEDCSTGIALASSEGTSNVIMADLTQAMFTRNSPNFWTAGFENVAATVIPLPGTLFSAGTSGISVAQGASHLAIVTGEFGGNSFAVLQLPSTSGGGKPPKLVDWAYVPGSPPSPHTPPFPSVFPPEPDGTEFSAGLDPHTITAYVSPNSGKAIAVMANSPPPNCLAVIDMAAVLHAPRQSDGHTVAPPLPGEPPFVSFVWTGQGKDCTTKPPS